MKQKQIRDLTAAHKARYVTHEQALFERTLRYYNGKFNSGMPVSSASARNPRAPVGEAATVNLVYATVETVLNALTPTTQAIYAKGITPEGEAVQEAAAHVINAELRRNDFLDTCRMTLIDSAMRRRGIFKTILDPDPNNLSQFRGVSIRDVHPATLFYDRDARTIQDVSYWGQCLQMPWRVFEQRVASGDYAQPRGGLRGPEGKVGWLNGMRTNTDRNATADVFGYAIVWEVYDLFDGRVYHWHEASDTILFESGISGHPYAMFSPNHNGENLDGLSEIELILPQQERINDIRQLFLQVAYRMVPRILYDTGVIDQAELDKALQDGPGTFRGFKRQNTASNKTLSDAFFPLPMAQIPDGLIQINAVLEADAQYVSGMLAQQRGQAQNVRTAQEMAVMDAASRGRLTTRAATFNGAVSRVAQRTLKLMAEYVPGPYHYKDRDEWKMISNIDFRKFDGILELTAYSPISSNPQAMGEVLSGLANWLTQNPEIDQRALTEMVLTGFGVPVTRALIPKEESLRKQQAMMAQAGGAPAGAAMMDPAAMEAAVAEQDATAQVDPAMVAAPPGS